MATIKTTIDTTTKTLTIDVSGVGQLQLAMSDVSYENQTYAMLHGLKQRIIDAAALSRDTATGASATPEDKFDAMKGLVDHYASGTVEWGMRATAGGGAGVASGIIIRALAAVKGWTVTQARERVDAKSAEMGLSSREYLAKLAKQPAMITAVAEIRAAESKAPDADSMLDEI